MAKLSLFTYHVILHPEDAKKGEKQKDSVLIIKPTTVLAKDQQSLAFKVSREIPEKYVEYFERIEIGIAPFSKRTRKVTDSSLTIIGPEESLIENMEHAHNAITQDSQIIREDGSWQFGTSNGSIPFTLTGSDNIQSKYFNAAKSLSDANI